MYRRTNVWILTASLLVATSLAGTLRAQTLEEVVVTVERRQQNLQDFAGTAQAFSQEELQRRGAGFDFQSLQSLVPGMQVSVNEGFQEIYIRGIGTQNNGAGSDQPTAVHYNGAYIPKMRGLGPVMFDLERVEVNQGPQGTLRGRNATAGSVNIIPKAPQLQQFGGKAAIASGNFSLQEVEAALNVPVGTTVALRAAYYSREHSDYYSNAGRGRSSQDVRGTGSEDEESSRLSLLWQPHEQFSGILVYDHMTQGGSGFPGNYADQLFSTGRRIEDLDDPWRQFFQTQGAVDNEIDSLVLTLKYDFEALGAELIASRRKFAGLTVNARRPFQYGFATPEIGSVDDFTASGRWSVDNFNTNYISDDNDTSTFELRLYAPAGSRLLWTAGAFYLDEQADEFRWDTSDASALNQNNLGGPDLTNATAEVLSLYLDGVYSLSDRLRLKAGIRATSEDKTLDTWEAQLRFGPFADTLDIDRDGDTSELIGAGGPIDQLVRLSTPGFRIVRAGEQVLRNPLTDFASAETFLRSIVRDFGGRDNLDELLAANPGAGLITTTFPGGIYSRDYSDDYVDWRLGLEYDLSQQSLLYATLTTGTRAGGINNPVFDANGMALAETFDTEELLSLEIGWKNELKFTDSSLLFNLAAFLYQYDNQVFQVGVAGAGGFDPGSSNVAANLQQVNVNIGESQIFGLSLDGRYRFGPQLSLGWNVLYLDGEVEEGYTFDGRQNAMTLTGVIDCDANPGVQPDEVCPVSQPNVDVSGNKLINLSDLTAVIDFGQSLQVPWGTLDWTLSLSYRSEFHATIFNNRGYDIFGRQIPLAQMPTCCGSAAADPAFGDGRAYNDLVEAVALWNAQVGTSFGNDRQYRLEAFGMNLTEQVYAQKQIINHFVNIAFLNPPRTYGVRFHVRF